MKKILIIQTDTVYFLEETLRTIEAFKFYFSSSEIILLANEIAFKELTNAYNPLLKNISTDIKSVLHFEFEISFNLSLNKDSWEIQKNVKSHKKIGATLNSNGSLIIEEAWSNYFLIQNYSKSFLAFHLRDIYRNILGIKNIPDHQDVKKPNRIGTIILPRKTGDEKNLLFLGELRKCLEDQNQDFSFKYLNEVDFVENFEDAIYIGSPCVESLRLNELGCKSILISSHFEGMNLLPYEENNYLLILRSHEIKFTHLIDTILSIITNRPLNKYKDVSIYETTNENNFGAQLKCLANPDVKFLMYQINIVLWNYILNLFDVKLNIHMFNKEEVQYLKELSKLIDKTQKIIDVGIICCETIYHQSRNEIPDIHCVENYINQIKDIEACLEKTAESNSVISHFLDFYKLKRSYETDPKLSAIAQATLINFIEEKHVFSAFRELIDIVVKQNDQPSKV